MATHKEYFEVCRECGAKLASGLRYCAHCYSPVSASSTRPHVELAGEITTTRRADPTMVFSPERHEAIARRTRSRKRLIFSAIIVLMAIVVGSVSLKVINRQRRDAERVMARDRAAQREISTMADALERFRADVLRYPTNEEGLRSLARRPAVISESDSGRLTYWYGPYLETVPEVDPWGNDYVYKAAGDGRSFELFSYGPGGETGSDSRFRVASTNATAIDN
jgi:general secretion pathway protein G